MWSIVEIGIFDRLDWRLWWELIELEFIKYEEEWILLVIMVWIFGGLEWVFFFW